VASGDRDAFQLASPYTTILYPSRGGEIARIGPEEVRQRYGVDPKQVPDFTGGGAPPLSIDRHDGCIGAAALTGRSGAHLGQSIDFCAQWGLNQLADRLAEKA
jgi:hypothetical protein